MLLSFFVWLLLFLRWVCSALVAVGAVSRFSNYLIKTRWFRFIPLLTSALLVVGFLGTSRLAHEHGLDVIGVEIPNDVVVDPQDGGSASQIESRATLLSYERHFASTGYMAVRGDGSFPTGRATGEADVPAAEPSPNVLSKELLVAALDEKAGTNDIQGIPYGTYTEYLRVSPLPVNHSLGFEKGYAWFLLCAALASALAVISIPAIGEMLRYNPLQYLRTLRSKDIMAVHHALEGHEKPQYSVSYTVCEAVHESRSTPFICHIIGGIHATSLTCLCGCVLALLLMALVPPQADILQAYATSAQQSALLDYAAYFPMYFPTGTYFVAKGANSTPKPAGQNLSAPGKPAPSPDSPPPAAAASPRDVFHARRDSRQLQSGPTSKTSERTAAAQQDSQTEASRAQKQQQDSGERPRDVASDTSSPSTKAHAPAATNGHNYKATAQTHATANDDDEANNGVVGEGVDQQLGQAGGGPAATQHQQFMSEDFKAVPRRSGNMRRPLWENNEHASSNDADAFDSSEANAATLEREPAEILQQLLEERNLPALGVFTILSWVHYSIAVFGCFLFGLQMCLVTFVDALLPLLADLFDLIFYCRVAPSWEGGVVAYLLHLVGRAVHSLRRSPPVAAASETSEPPKRFIGKLRTGSLAISFSSKLIKIAAASIFFTVLHCSPFCGGWTSFLASNHFQLAFHQHAAIIYSLSQLARYDWMLLWSFAVFYASFTLDFIRLRRLANALDAALPQRSVRVLTKLGEGGQPI
eukprot:GHVT01066856.1.p1 GENE.GHVT01066856.1~~GHVT01066856.1.p1  ORF type:complete len:756 (-),score=137.87 GHVT01066856.1:657-2924(-)